jgi:hypothetical protein
MSLPRLKPSTRTISLRLPEALLDHLKVLANAQDVPYQSLLKLLLAERVTEELEERRVQESFFWVRFTIGDVFPADSPLAVWVAGLAMIANDLLLVKEPLLPGPGEFEAARVHTFWLVCAQYREAARFVASGLDEPYVKRFNRGLDSEVQSLLRRVRASFDPWEGSFVQRVAKPIRDRLFHYPSVGARDWRDVLTAHASTPSGVEFRGSRRIRDTHAVFADDLRASLLAESLGLSSPEIAESMSELADLVGMLVRIAHQSLGAFLEQVPTRKLEVGHASPVARWIEDRVELGEGSSSR